MTVGLSGKERTKASGREEAEEEETHGLFPRPLTHQYPSRTRVSQWSGNKEQQKTKTSQKQQLTLSLTCKSITTGAQHKKAKRQGEATKKKALTACFPKPVIQQPSKNKRQQKGKRTSQNTLKTRQRQKNARSASPASHSRQEAGIRDTGQQEARELEGKEKLEITHALPSLRVTQHMPRKQGSGGEKTQWKRKDRLQRDSGTGNNSPSASSASH